MDIATFLLGYPPFDSLEPDALADVVRHTSIEFFPAGAVILRQSGAPARFAYLVRTGAVELVDQERLLDQLGPGELFGHPSMLAGAGPSFTVRAHEDTLCYLIEANVMGEVLRSREGLAFLSKSLRSRMGRALEGLSVERADPWRTQVEKLIRRPPITCLPETSIREAARTMAETRVSSLLVLTADGWGILTDRDLRTRVIAEGRGTDGPVADVLTWPAVTIPAEALATEALRAMLENGVHHLPVVHRSGDVVGVVTDSDLMGLERRTPFALSSSIERAATREAAIAAARELPEAVGDLVDAHVDAVDIGHVVGVTRDALVRRLLEFAIEEAGDPPAAWAWISLGSQARHEQALHTDQDHAFAFDSGGTTTAPPKTDSYFAKVAASVTDAVEQTGVPRCKAGVSASEPSWRRTLPGWEKEFARWMQDSSPDGAILTAIAWDYHGIAGPLRIESALDRVLREAPRYPVFLKHLASQATGLRPPTGFLRDLVVQAKGEHAGELDIKHGGLTAITSIARVYALAAGVTEKRTLDRLREVTALGHLQEADRHGLEEAFRLLWQIRLEHQVAQARRGEEPNDFVDPKELGPVTRQGVKETFRTIDRVQRSLAAEYGLRLR